MTILSFPSDDQREYEQLREKADIRAGDLFRKATRSQQAEYDAAMAAIACIPGPAWRRKRDAIKARFADQTKEARELCDRTFDELMATGEISEELDDHWTRLIAEPFPNSSVLG